MRRFRGMPFEERVALAAAVILSLLACVGQGVTYFTDDYDSYSTGIFVSAILSLLAGVALTFEADVLPDSLDEAANNAKAEKLGTALKQTLLVCGIQLVVGELIFLVGLALGASGINGDFSVILGPVFIGVLIGALGCVLGIVVGLMVAWPIVKLVQLAFRRRRGKPASPAAPIFAILFLTIIAFATLGTLGSNPPDVLGSPTGKGFYDIIYLYTNYTGTPPQQAMAWIARVLGAVVVLEVIWLRRVGLARKRGDYERVAPVAASTEPRTSRPRSRPRK